VSSLIISLSQVGFNEMDDEWPAGHTIGVFLGVGDDSRLVGTARGKGDLARLFRFLADEWDRMQVDPTVRAAGDHLFFPEAWTSAGSHPARGA
jgi:hypothetical protein